jgi:hypothetical protein
MFYEDVESWKLRIANFLASPFPDFVEVADGKVLLLRPML